ncbi:MAG: hypothetical protein ACXAES_14440, partial [Promethearchaeota archaeon]
MTIKIRTAKYKRSGEPLQFKEIEIKCKGTGVKEDPFILDSSSDLPEDFEIVESKAYIIIKNCNIKYLVLGYSKNITIKDSSFRALYLYDCTDITINKCHISLMTLNICQNCLLKNSKFDTSFKIFKCYNNTIKACEWDVFFDSENLSRGNTLENIEEPFLEDIIEIRKPLEKTTDSFAISTSTFSHPYRFFLKDIECQGTGTVNDPIIIDNSNVNKAGLRNIELSPNRHHVIFKNLSLKKIRIIDAKHVTLENCNFSKSIHLKFCSDIKMSAISTKSLKFGA